jgi:hypothetical protein
MERAGLEEGHEHVEDSAEYMGCGRPAVSDGRRWNADAFWDEMRLYKRSRSEVHTLAIERWSYSNFGSVLDVLGFLWDGCPHAVLANATPSELTTARRAISIRRMAHIGAAPMLGKLTAAGVQCVAMVDRYIKHLESVSARRAQDAARAKAKAKGRK